MAVLLDGKTTARAIRDEIARDVAKLKDEAGIVPCLAAILAGDDPASATYVKMKRKACEEAGIISDFHPFGDDVTTGELVQLICELNFSPEIDGVLIQHPLPKGVDEASVLRELSPDKDVDGVTTASLGRLFANEEGYVSCTALGALTLMDRYKIPLAGRRAVVLGRSLIIGKPITAMLINRNATVTVCHSRTQNLPDVVREADIVVAAIGKPEFVKGDWLKPGCVVVDVGYNRVEGRQGDVGDVDFEEAKKVCSYITPVPGGCGPMTIAMLLQNTLRSAKKRAAKRTGEAVIIA